MKQVQLESVCGRKEYFEMDRPSTFDQRRELFELHTRLGWDRLYLRDLNYRQAEFTLRRARRALEEIENNFETESDEIA
jgi:hypothetical protein